MKPNRNTTQLGWICGFFFNISLDLACGCGVFVSRSVVFPRFVPLLGCGWQRDNCFLLVGGRVRDSLCRLGPKRK